MSAMTKLKVCRNKVLLRMAERCMNPYDLCNSASISYTSYRRIMKEGTCKIATLGKIAHALECNVAEIVEN